MEINVRKDYYGNVIIKKQKKHKITFVDSIEGKQLAEIYPVKSLKVKDGKI